MLSLPISAVIATKDRPGSLARTLASLATQEVSPKQLVLVDASADNESRKLLKAWRTSAGFRCAVIWQRAIEVGAATQRNQGVAIATQPFVWFLDDDVLFKPECLSQLWRAMQSDSKLGGVNTTIVNQRYHELGAVSRIVFSVLHGQWETSFAGRVIGPAVNILPEDRDELPVVVPVEWLNTTCTLYRREALPTPPFDSVFTGYSMMEDLTLSLRVAKKWKLANARTARIFHDSQPGAHKADVREMAQMELVNRHYVMTAVMGRTKIRDYFRLFLWELFQLVSCVGNSKSRSHAVEKVRGQLKGLCRIRRVSP
jgi:GT2 family glycosyltransferase